MRSIPLLLAALLALSGCSLRKFTLKQVGGALGGLSDSLAADEDIQLVGDAVPFSLKLIETLLDSSPQDRELLRQAASGFAQYSYAYVQMPADEIEERDRAAALAMRARAGKLYLRAKSYGMRGLETRYPSFAARLKENPKEAVKAVNRKDDVPFLYWSAVSGAAALASTRDLTLLPQLPQFEALIQRALELDEGYNGGALHSFLILFETNKPLAPPSKYDKAKEHFDRAIALSGGKQAGPYVSYAENVSLPRKDKAEFQKMLAAALKVDPNADPANRLQNLLLQKRARWLQSRVDKLFGK
jgi:predicted anti-sigma-YlaC factor YlaD